MLPNLQCLLLNVESKYSSVIYFIFSSVIRHDRFIMAVVQKFTASLQKIVRNSNFSRMMSSGQGSGRSEGKLT